MNYRDRVLEYFKFSSEALTSANGRGIYAIQITGKISRRLVVIWLTLSLVILFISLCTGPVVLGYIMKNESNVFSLGYWSTIINLIITFLAIIIVLIKSKLVFKKLEPKNTNINLYARELPSKLRPAHVRMLINDGLVDNVSFTSTILDLIDRGYLAINKEEKKDLFVNKYMKLIRTTKSDQDLLKYEKFIIDWVISQYDNDKKVSFEELNNIDNSPSYSFEEWQALVIMSFPLGKYFKKATQSRTRVIYAIFFFFGFLYMFPFISLFLGIYGFGCLLLASPMYTLIKEGVDEGGEWLNLKRFLIDFGNMENKTVEMLEVWEFYLTYSIALNVPSEATKEIEDFFNNSTFNGQIGSSSTYEREAVINTINNRRANTEGYSIWRTDANIKNMRNLKSVIRESKLIKEALDKQLELSNKQLEQEIVEEMKKL